MVAVLIDLPFILMGVIPLIISLKSYKKGKKYASESKVIVGEIVDVVQGFQVLDEPRGWFPTIMYWDERTNSYLLYKSNTGGSFKWQYKIGAKIELRYLYTDKGVDVRTNTSMAIYGLSRHGIAIGSIVTVANIAIVTTILMLS